MLYEVGAFETGKTRRVGMLLPVVYLAILCIVVSAGCDAAAFGREAFHVTVNGAPCTTDAPYYPIHTGRANSLAIRAEFERLGQDALTATLVRTCPDSRSDES